MKQVLAKLMVLQKLDIRQMQIESLKGDLPNQVNRLNQELEKAEQAYLELSEKLRAYEKEHAILEMDIKALEGKQKIYQSQLFQVKNNREYDAVTSEIESVKAEIVKKENRLLEVYETIDNTKKLMILSREEADKLKNQFDSKKTELEGKLEKSKKEEETLLAERKNLTVQLEPKLLATYERIRSAKNGFGVVPVVDNACGGCHKMLPPQKLMEIREMDRIYICETCGRIIVWDEKISENSK